MRKATCVATVGSVQGARHSEVRVGGNPALICYCVICGGRLPSCSRAFVYSTRPHRCERVSHAGDLDLLQGPSAACHAISRVVTIEAKGAQQKPAVG